MPARPVRGRSPCSALTPITEAEESLCSWPALWEAPGQLMRRASSPETRSAAKRDPNVPRTRSDPSHRAATRRVSAPWAEAQARAARKESPPDHFLRAPGFGGYSRRAASHSAQAEALRTARFRASLCDERLLDDGLDDRLRALTPPRDHERAGRARVGSTRDAEFHRRSMQVVAVAQEAGAREVSAKNQGSRIAECAAERTAAWLEAAQTAQAEALRIARFRASLCDERLLDGLDDGLDERLRALTPPRDRERAGRARVGGTRDAKFHRRSMQVVAVAQEAGAREVSAKSRGSGGTHEAITARQARQEVCAARPGREARRARAQETVVQPTFALGSFCGDGEDVPVSIVWSCMLVHACIVFPLLFLLVRSLL